MKVKEGQFKLHVTLKSGDRELFDKIKKELNLSSNAEVIRYLMGIGYEDIKRRKLEDDYYLLKKLSKHDSSIRKTLKVIEDSIKESQKKKS